MEALDQVLEAALERAAQEPAARAAERREAVAELRAAGLPDTRVEAWKYTSLAPIAKTPFRLADSSDAAVVDGAAFSALERATADLPALVFVNGWLRPDLSDIERLPAGVSIAVASLGDSVASSSPGDAGSDFGVTREFGASAFTTLNDATLTDAVAIQAASGVEVSQAMALVFVGGGKTPVLRAPRVLIRGAANSGLRVVEEYLAPGEDHGLTNVVTSVELADGARLHHHRLQTESNSAAHVGRIVASVGRDALFHSDSVAFGARLGRLDIDVALNAAGASCTLNGLFAADGEQHIDHHTTVEHRVGDTHSDELYRGILDGSSRGVFNGKVIVHKDAQRISARQASHNLLLSRRAEIDTKPELEIYADDVTCAHGATVGELDEAALFYLRSRGVSKAEARALLIYAFAEKVVSAVPLESLKRAIEQRFIGHNEASMLADSVGGGVKPS